MQQVYGRTAEKRILDTALESEHAEMIAVIGRRRVGKTFLVRQHYADRLRFYIAGIQGAPKEEQLQNFAGQLKKYSKSQLELRVPKSWQDAFFMLSEYLDTQLSEEKVVVFLDELPWLSTHRSGFLRGLSWFWNSWAVEKRIVVTICGSAASWMIDKVVNNKGGLHNRITRRIQLQPFSLGETEHYLNRNGRAFDRYQVLQLYMAMGGIPHYLKEVAAGKSAIQNIDAICFSPTGLLADEFTRLYASLFERADRHVALIKSLAGKRKGMTREELSNKLKQVNGGTLSRILEELTISGFISVYRPFGKKKKQQLYRLTDEYSLFYLQFIEGKAYEGPHIWQHLSQTATYKSWAGYTFESICLKHIPQIKQALSIAGIYSLSSSFYKRGTDDAPGAQIDLLIDRNDQVINLFEVKFYIDANTITKTYANKLREKASIFRAATDTKKQLSWVFLTVHGLKENVHSRSLSIQSLTADVLFLE